MQAKLNEDSILEDAGHILVKCSNCRAILMDIWRSRPHEKQTWKIKAKCPWCQDSSFPVTVKGGFHCGGYGVRKPDDPDDEFVSTKLEPPEIVDDLFVFPVLKASPAAKPMY